MNRINQIYDNECFKMHLERINEAEYDRIYCLHGIEHLMDVARIGYILNIEEKLGYEKEVIYAMALLHDIGRNLQYKQGSSHHEAGADIAGEILADAGFEADTIKAICSAIKSHNKPGEDDDCSSLNYLLYKADKLSRNCYACRAHDTCYWDEEKKNKKILI